MGKLYLFNAKVTIDLRRASNLPNILRRTQKSLKGDITPHHVDFQAMDRNGPDFINDKLMIFCGFGSVAVNIMDKLQFLIFI